MLTKIFISIVAVMLAVTSPLLCYWEHAVEASVSMESDCCVGCHCTTSDKPEQPQDESQNCDCKYRIAVPQISPCDIAELAAQHLPGNDLAAIIATSDSNIEQFSGLSISTPVHFSPPADGGSLCARLGRFLL